MATMVEKVFNDHCTNEHNWGKFACPNENCEFVSYSQYCFKSHNRMHIIENIGKNLTQACPRKNCEKKFQNMHGLKNHLKIHDNDFIRCFYCQWAGTNYQQYSIHMNTHFRNKTYKCQFCPKAFYDVSAVSKHIDFVHDRDTEKYSCTNCDFKTHSKDYLNIHKRTCCK